MANTKVTTNVIADDAITGAKIADDAINSEHYTDGSIDTAHIADDQVTLAKMAGLARGKIIYGDSSGNPAALAVGSNGQVLKSDGTDISWGTDSSNDRDGAAVFNESGAAVDFRIEGDTVENLFFVDGGNDNILLGTQNQGHIRLNQQLGLAVSGNVYGGISFVTHSSTASGNRTLLDFNRSRNDTIGSHTVVNNGDALGTIVFRGDDGDEFLDACYIQAEVDGTPGNGDMPGRLAFYTTADGSDSSTERMRITSAGDVGIGQTPVANSRLTVKTQGDGTYPIRVVNSADSDMLFGVYESSDGDGNNGMVYINDGAGNTDVKLSTNGVSWFNGGNVGIGTTSPGSKLTVTEAGDGNTPTMHIIDSADTEVAWFEGNRAGDTGAFIAVRHNPSSQAESNRSGIKFQADDDGGNVTNYAKITQYIEDNTNTTEDARLGINVMSDGSDNEVVNIRKDQFIYTGDAGSSFIRVDNRADGHDTGFEIYQNGTRRWEIHNDDSHDNQLDFRPGGNSEAMCIRSTGQVRIGVAPDIGGVLTVQKSNAGVPVLYAKNTNADSLGIRAEVNANSSNNAIIEAINSDGQQWKIRNDGDHFGSDTSIGSISDSRLKKDVSDLTYDIAKFKQYRPVEFNWINDELHRSPDSGKTRGFLAQEIGAIDTYYVDKYDAEGDDIPLVDEDGMAHSTKFGYKDAMYISVIKQLITRLEAAEAKITALEG